MSAEICGCAACQDMREALKMHQPASPYDKVTVYWPDVVRRLHCLSSPDIAEAANTRLVVWTPRLTQAEVTVLDEQLHRAQVPIDPGATAADPMRSGAVVRLKSGGPDMTVDAIYENGNVCCVWFAADTLTSRLFAPEHLVLLFDRDGHPVPAAPAAPAPAPALTEKIATEPKPTAWPIAIGRPEDRCGCAMCRDV